MEKVLSTISPWDLPKAVAYLCLDHKPPEEDRVKLVRAALARGRSRTKHADQSEALAEAMPRVLEAMKLNELPLDHQMLGALWIKLFHASGVPISADAIRDIKTRRLELSSQRPTLFQMRNDQTGVEMWIGPETSLRGFEATRGYSFEELLLLTFTSATYAQEWRVIELRPLSHRVRRSAPSGAIGSTLLQGPRSEDEYREVYGSGLMAELAAACDAEAAKPRAGILQKGSRDQRRYSANLSLSALVELLRERHRGLQSYASSTLKAALPQFVACPRGRPPRKDAGA